MASLIKPGETQRFDCEECECEWEVTLEPKAAGKPKEIAAMNSQEVTRCPFCGAALPDDDEDLEDE
jgi:uncharacterized protein with PIN domain